MKTLKKCIALALSCFCALSVFAGCGDADKAETDNEYTEITYCDFESWQDGFEFLRMAQNFGRITVNTDVNYVKTGKQSARLDPLGFADYFYSKPEMSFPMTSSRFDFDYSDFEYVDSIEFSIYNPQEEDKEVFVNLVSAYSSSLSWTNLPKTTFVLKNGWNDCSLPIDEGLVTLFGGNIHGIAGLAFSFWNQESMNVTETTDYYFLDTIKIIKKQTKDDVTFSMNMEENEIAFFEKPWQSRMFDTENTLSWEIVKASDYGVTATEGSHVLRTLWKHQYDAGTYEYTKTGGYQYLLISKMLLENSGLSDLNVLDASKIYICFDFYNNSDSSVGFGVRFRAGDADKGTIFYIGGATGSSKEWSTFECCADVLYEANQEFFKKPGALELTLHDDGYDREIFFDNIRIEVR